MPTTDLAAPSMPQIRRRRTLIAPAFRRLPPPIVVIGMHRSGTSLVAGMLSLMGAYFGPETVCPDGDGTAAPPADDMRRGGYGEAQAFRRINKRLLFLAGGDWVCVQPFLGCREDRVFARSCVLGMQLATFTSLRSSYFPERPPHPIAAWGWKDPRTSLTLPYWLHLFPDARVLHVCRNPNKVVDSLVRRESAEPLFEDGEIPRWSSLAYMLAGAIRLQRRTTAWARRRPPAPPIPSYDPSDRDHWLRLTDIYVRECRRYEALGSRYLEVSMEDIVRAPDAMARELADFACLEPKAADIDRAVSFVG